MSDTSNTLMDIPYYTDECIHIPRYAICCLVRILILLRYYACQINILYDL
jgi:hypothetical protein